jgi:flagellar biosynthesis protein FlhA
MLIALNIAIALLVLMMVMYVNEPLQFSVFPGLLLVLTLFRLGLNGASTRMILADGYAGKVIAAFGNFVVKGNYIVGLIILLILVLINFVVITKGSGRIAEVAARFTLDAMPGKQMAIDADLNNGVIDEGEARDRRDKIRREADFYGAMDPSILEYVILEFLSLFVSKTNAIGDLKIYSENDDNSWHLIGEFSPEVDFAKIVESWQGLETGSSVVAALYALNKYNGKAELIMDEQTVGWKLNIPFDSGK